MFQKPEIYASESLLELVVVRGVGNGPCVRQDWQLGSLTIAPLGHCLAAVSETADRIGQGLWRMAYCGGQP
jgi:hypothetical protein